jgi:AraC-like DNA-binding protein
MQPVGLTRAGVVLPITGFLRRIGAPVERLLAQSGLPPWILDEPEALIPTMTTARLLTHAARVEGIENIGLLSGQEASIETLGIFGRLIRRSRTVGEALETIVRYHPAFSSNGRMWLSADGDHVEVCNAIDNGFDDGWEQVSHYSLMLMLGIIRLGADPTWRPAAIKLQTTESAVLRDVEALCTTRVEFAQPATTVVLPRALLAAPLRRPPVDLELPEGIESWSASGPDHNFAGSVVQVIEMLSWDSYPSIHRTADILGVSVRTLQRHLAAAGCTHESLVGQARFATAASLLEETNSKILDIALDLGYSDHAHFTRAFRRWSGHSPQEYRRAYRANHHDA